jgi:hypothetical protein
MNTFFMAVGVFRDKTSCHFRDNMYREVNKSVCSVRGCIVRGRNVQGGNVEDVTYGDVSY